MVSAPEQGNSEWPTAAVVGTLLGEHIEAVAGEYLGALTQLPVTTTLPNGLVVDGTADIVIPEQNLLADVKTKVGLSEVRKDGPSLENLVQVSIYVLGLVQMGVLKEGASASLIYADRGGTEQVLYEVSIDWERIEYFIGVVVDRLADVLDAQEHIDKGEVEYARALRDKTPPFCYSPRVMCPFRDLCWEGSEWVPDETIEDAETIAVVESIRRSARRLQPGGGRPSADARAPSGGVREDTLGVQRELGDREHALRDQGQMTWRRGMDR